MNENVFTWVPFFEELADCLLKYKNNRKELIALIKQAHELVGKSLPKIENDNNNIPDIDPFTIYALFNRGKQSTNSRSQICEGYKRTFGIKSDVPTDFSGIPVYAYNQYCFYRYINDPKRVENCFELLWALFESAIEYSRDSLNSQRFCECFEKCLNLPMVGFAKLTMGLYQIRPTTYVNIDKLNVPLIETRIKIPRNINVGKEYLSFCAELKNNLYNSFNCDTFFELSFLAFQYSVDSTHTQSIPIENVDFHIETNNNAVGGQALMERYSSKNIILYGPPGTGKTFITMAYAVAIIEKKDFNEVKVEADEDYSKVKDRYEIYKKEGLIDFVTFHQSYGYEEFVQGIKPVTKNGSIFYEVQDGIFKKFCDKAKKKKDDKNNNCVFIIDEINRGNISKIFGELITLIEDTKREGANEEMEVTLPYIDKEGKPISFTVPQNVYIIGTMNTADRSIAAIDTALRRRFTFIKMMPDYAVMKNNDNTPIEVDGVDIAKMLAVMNERIAVLYDREHTIGHAYFMSLRDKKGTSIKDVADIFRNKIIPLLQEYFYEDYGKIRLILGDNRKDEKLQFIKNKDINYSDLFGNTGEYELGERSKTYAINEDAFQDSKAYIGIYELANDQTDNGNG